MNGLLKIQQYDGEGLDYLVHGDGWDVLLLNHLPRLGHGAVTQLHKHTETKETFVLLAGKVLLLTATGTDTPEDIFGVEMEQGKVYTAERGVWHATVMTEDAKILLVENAHTTAENTFRAELNEAQVKTVFDLGKEIFK